MSRSSILPPGTSRRALAAVALVLLGAGVLLGCGRGTVVGRQYDNLTAYYNTFYNATQAFEKGLASINRSSENIDRTQYISVFPNPQAGSGGSGFEDAIQKSADLLRQHPESKWVDDALLIIGRSRYYQQNYAGAAQKFREVIALETEREGEARFRLVQTLVAADRGAAAAKALRLALEGDRDYEGDWTARMRLVQGELFVRQEQWADAERALASGVDGPLPDRAGARGAFLLGQVRETLEDRAGAQAAYEQVLDYAPRYPLEFAARLGAIEMQGLQGELDRALARLSGLGREDDTNEMRAERARVRARLYEANGQPDRAKQVLVNVLRGEDAPTGRTQGRVHYDLGTIYRDTYENFTLAAAHFDTAATSLPSGTRQGASADDSERQVLPRAPTDAAAQADRFRGLADRSQTVARLDSLLRIGRLPQSEYRAFVEQLRARRREAQQREAQAQRRQQQQFRGDGAPQNAVGGRPSGRSRTNAVQTRGGDAGFLFHQDPTLVQEGRRQFEQTWGDRPLTDNWRRVTAIQGEEASPATADAPSAAEGQAPVPGAGTEAGVDVSAVPRDSAAQAEMEARRAVARYELANALFRAAGRPDSAETWFRQILRENEDHSVARQALYGLAQAHRAQGDSTAAEGAYRRLMEAYPNTPYAKRAREQLGLESRTTTAPETSAADSAYARAFNRWQAGAARAALDQFFAVARGYPATDAAPRALLAAGVVYRRQVARDTSESLQAQFERHVDSLASSVAGEREDSLKVVNASRPPREESTTAVPSPDTTAPRSAQVPRRAPDAPQDPSRPTPQRAVPDTASQNPRQPQLRAQPQPDSQRSAPEPPVRGPDRGTTPPPAPRPDTTGAALDTIATPSEARPQRPADSTATDASTADPTGAATRPSSPDPLRILLSHLTEQYAGTPEAERAQALLDHLTQQSAPPDTARAESSASRPASTPTDTSQTPDRTLQSVSPGAATTPVQPDTSAADTTRSNPTQGG